jgi:hypothetical protein
VPRDVQPQCHCRPYDEIVTARPAEHGAQAEDLDAAEADAILQQHDGWVAAGRPGALAHEEVMTELLGDSR